MTPLLTSTSCRNGVKFEPKWYIPLSDLLFYPLDPEGRSQDNSVHSVIMEHRILYSRGNDVYVNVRVNDVTSIACDSFRNGPLKLLVGILLEDIASKK